MPVGSASVVSSVSLADSPPIGTGSVSMVRSGSSSSMSPSTVTTCGSAVTDDDLESGRRFARCQRADRERLRVLVREHRDRHARGGWIHIHLTTASPRTSTGTSRTSWSTSIPPGWMRTSARASMTRSSDGRRPGDLDLLRIDGRGAQLDVVRGCDLGHPDGNGARGQPIEVDGHPVGLLAEHGDAIVDRFHGHGHALRPAARLDATDVDPRLEGRGDGPDARRRGVAHHRDGFGSVSRNVSAAWPRTSTGMDPGNDCVLCENTRPP